MFDIQYIYQELKNLRYPGYFRNLGLHTTSSFLLDKIKKTSQGDSRGWSGSLHDC
jgi:hypothetical protein